MFLKVCWPTRIISLNTLDDAVWEKQIKLNIKLSDARFEFSCLTGDRAKVYGLSEPSRYELLA